MAYDKKISIRINVDKIQKEHLYKGEKGRYLTMTIKPTPESRFGYDYSVSQYWKDDTLPEGEYPKTPFLGDGKDLYTDNNSTTGPTKQAPVIMPERNDGSEDLPF